MPFNKITTNNDSNLEQKTNEGFDTGNDMGVLIKRALVMGVYIPFTPEFADKRAENAQNNTDDNIWNKMITTRSLEVMKVIFNNVYIMHIHIPHFFCDPKILKNKEAEGLIGNAIKIPNNLFEYYWNLSDNKHIFKKIYHKDGENFNSNLPKPEIFTIKEALKIDYVIHFLGGENIAKIYLDKHKQIIGEKIKIEPITNLLGEITKAEYDGPIARFARLGNNKNNGLLGTEVGKKHKITIYRY
ncbi:MAG: hypothetical protein QXG00_01695 [Candidatus Woesearchaeota archaeon]